MVLQPIRLNIGGMNENLMWVTCPRRRLPIAPKWKCWNLRTGVDRDIVWAGVHDGAGLTGVYDCQYTLLYIGHGIARISRHSQLSERRCRITQDRRHVDDRKKRDND